MNKPKIQLTTWQIFLIFIGIKDKPSCTTKQADQLQEKVVEKKKSLTDQLLKIHELGSNARYKQSK